MTRAPRSLRWTPAGWREPEAVRRRKELLAVGLMWASFALCFVLVLGPWR